MKKTYDKPKLIALSLSGNNMLCNTCAIDIMGDNADKTFKETMGDFFDVNKAFASYEQCEKPISIDGYCKFTGADHGSRVVINS